MDNIFFARLSSCLAWCQQENHARFCIFIYLLVSLSFPLPKKQALDNALETALQLALSVPLADVTAYPKLCKAYFVFFEILFRNHITVVVALDTPVFMRVMHALHEGLQVLLPCRCCEC